MTDLDAFAIGEPGPATPTGAGPRRHRHVWAREFFDDPHSVNGLPATNTMVVFHTFGPATCTLCGKHRDEARARRGRTSRARGIRIQRQRIVGLGATNLAGNNPSLDGIGERFRYESKSGGAFPERLWRWLKSIPAGHSQAGVLIITDAPGPGHRARSLVVLDYDDWRDEHGETP